MPIFPKLKQKPPKLANHNRSHYFRDSVAPGALVPIYVKPVNPGDEIYNQYESLVNTQALLSPLYGSYKLKIMTFFAGTSLYVPKLWRNGSMQQTDGTLDAGYPLFDFPYYGGSTSAINTLTVNPSSLLAHLGFNPGYLHPKAGVIGYNAIPLLMYLDIFRHYFANRQEEKFPILNGSTYYNDSGYALAALDELFLNLPVNGGSLNGTPSATVLEDMVKLSNRPLGGMLVGTYLPDRMSVILNESFYSKNVTSVQVSTVGDKFQLDQLVTAKKLWNSRTKDAMSSGTFRDWIRMHFGVTPKIMDDMPTFLGASISDIPFEDIRATTSAQVGDTDQYLGDKAASGLGYSRSRRHSVIADRPGYIMTIAQIVPQVDYYQNLERFVSYRKLSDEFRPEFNGIGLQDVLVSDINADYTGNTSIYNNVSDLEDPRTISVGKQPAWIEYMTEVNRVRGTFCTTEKSWVLARDMRADPAQTTASPVDNTTISAYILPQDWNQPFAVQDAAAQNFYLQVFIRSRVRSTVLKRLLPYF